MKKIQLDKLEVQSFVTNVETKAKTYVGGATVNGPNCSIQYCESDICHGTRTCDDGATATCEYSSPALCTLAATACNCSQFPC